MIERLSGEFNRGYTKALLDVTELITSCEEMLKNRRKKMTSKQLHSLLKCCLDNREKLREADRHGFIRWNWQTEDWEWFEGGGGV